MLTRYKIPKTILWVINLFLIFLLIFTLFRLATFFAFKSDFKPGKISFTDIIPSFLMGVQYDLRWIAIILLPFPAHWDPKLRIPRGQVVAAASIVSPKY